MRDPLVFPAFVAQHTVAFDPAREPDVQFPDVPLPEHLSRAVVKRRAEFAAGRYCAREALRKLSAELATASIPIGDQREPVWPEGIVGSITHTHGYASVAVARRRDARGVGLDAERILPDAKAKELLTQIATEEEVDALLRATGFGVGVTFSLVFSAKETIFKALFGDVGRYFGFHDAFVDALEGDRFRAHLVATLTPTLAAGYEMEGRFERNEERVCTAMVILP